MHVMYRRRVFVLLNNDHNRPHITHITHISILIYISISQLQIWTCFFLLVHEPLHDNCIVIFAQFMIFLQSLCTYFAMEWQEIVCHYLASVRQ